MVRRTRNINLFLMDGVANGTIKITSKPWDGLVLRIPRNQLHERGEREEMKYSSIYFLVGPPEQGDFPTVYIGQVGMRGILKRLTEHDKNPDKQFWTEAIVLTTTDNKFDATDLNYLEHTFCSLATNSKQCIVKNVIEPTPGNISEEKECELEETVELTQIIFEVLGYKILSSAVNIAPFIPKVEVPAPARTEETTSLNKKIGKFVQEDIVKLLKSGQVPLSEVERLTSLEYCKKVFGKKVYYPVLVEWAENARKEDIAIINGYSRYYADIVLVFSNKRYLISSQWYKESYEPLFAWYKNYSL